jgi:hypothetical protein
MLNKIQSIDIYNKINNFNLKKKELIEFINKNKLTKDLIYIPEISLNNNIIQDIKKKLSEIKQEIIEDNNFKINLTTNRYTKQYTKTDDIFWGIGLENECYLQGSPKQILGKKIISMLGRERYSVDYTNNYEIEQVKQVMSQVYQPNKLYNVSQMINAHSFNKMDRNLEHKTTYEKEPKENKKFSGKTVFEEWKEYDHEINSMIDSNTKTETNIFFDGDTIEFITENFYNSNVDRVVDELVSNKKKFIEKFNKFKKETNLWNDLGEIRYPENHPGINIFNSQSDKIVFFNNTTIHLHLTLPTRIKDGLIINKKLFVETHAKAIKLLQWFEPFFICTLGSPDILQIVYEKYNKLTKLTKSCEKLNYEPENYFSKGSMRATISRYIGVGTFDTEKMTIGKLLTSPIEELRPKNVIWWRDMINEDLLYKLPENEIGYDFNYGKHYQSGLEFRILDGIPISILKDVLDIIILICEHSYSFSTLDSIPQCSTSQTWNNIIYKSMVYGYNATITKSEIKDILKVLNIDVLFNQNQISMEDFYYKILEYILSIYTKNETFALKYLTNNFTKINRWENFNKLQNMAHETSLNNL